MRLQERYGLILILVVVGYVVAGFDDNFLVRFSSLALYVGLVLLSLLTPHTAWWLRWLGITAVVLGGVLLVVSELADGHEGLRGASSLASAIAIVAALASVLATIARHERVETSTLLGAVLVYVLIGFVATLLYQGVDLLTNTPFFAQGEVDLGQSAYSYFAFVTLTTLGYGDLTPATEVGQRLVVVEAMAGQIFLVVLVARLVSMFGETLRASRADGSE